MLGLDGEVVGDDPAVIGYLRSVVRPFAAAGRAREIVALVGRPDGGFRVAHDGRWVLAPRGRADAVALLIWWLNQRSLELPYPDLLIHAGVVAREGRAVLVPGEPDAGKSTLVAALVRAGFEYLSDEAALVDVRSGFVRPFPRTMTLDRRSLELLPWLEPLPTEGLEGLAEIGGHVPPERLRGGCVAVDASEPALIVLPRVVEGGPTRLRAVAPADVVRRLSSLAFNLRATGRPGFQGLVRLTRRSRCVGLDLWGLDDAVRLVTNLHSG